MSELLATLEAPVYIERVALSDNKNIMKARKAMRKALELQRDSAGFSFMEILSPCPTIWNMTPQEARKWIAEKMLAGVSAGRVARSQTRSPWQDDSSANDGDEALGLDRTAGSSDASDGRKNSAPGPAP